MKLIIAKLRHYRYILIVFTIFSLVFSVRAYFLFSRKYSPGQRVRITERLTEQPYQSESSQIFELAGFKILTRDLPAYNYGDVLVVEGELKRSDSKQAFGLLRWLNEELWLIYPEIKPIEDDEILSFPQEGVWFKIGRLITNLRQKVVNLYRQVLPEPHASLLSGIVLGQRERMPVEFYTSLRNSGTLHVIAASGMNVTIVAGVMVSLLVRLFKRRVAAVAAVLGVAFYMLLAGGSAPIVRAAIMGTLSFVATILGRENDGKRALWLTAAAMLMWNPRYLVDVGWQLSVAATAGIVYLVPLWQRRVKVSSGLVLGAGKELAVTLSAQVTTLPLLMYHFGSVSWVAPLANLLIAPMVPIIMAWGGVIAVVGMVWGGLTPSLIWLTQIIAWGAWVILEYCVKVIELLGGSFGALTVERLPFVWVIGYYWLISWLVRRLRRKSDSTLK